MADMIGVLAAQAEELAAKKVHVAGQIRELAKQDSGTHRAAERAALEQEYVLLNRALAAINRIERQTNEQRAEAGGGGE